MAYTLELHISPETSKTSCVTEAIYVVRSSICLFVSPGSSSAIFVYVLMDINTLQNMPAAAHADQRIRSFRSNRSLGRSNVSCRYCLT